MSLSKHVRLCSLTSSCSKRFVNDIFFNIDLLSIIFKNFRVIEIIKIIKTNKYLYNYIKINNKSLNTIKICISYDFGKILSCKKFKISYKTSFELIKCV